MLKPVFLLDTGPLVSYLDLNDPHHEWARATIDDLTPPLLTCEPVLTEAAYLLSKTHNGLDLLAEFCDSGVVIVEFYLLGAFSEVHDLIRKYRNIPMDLADACLVHIAEGHHTPKIVTLDRDFLIYRTKRRRQLSLIAPFVD